MSLAATLTFLRIAATFEQVVRAQLHWPVAVAGAGQTVSLQ